MQDAPWRTRPTDASPTPTTALDEDKANGSKPDMRNLDLQESAFILPKWTLESSQCILAALMGKAIAHMSKTIPNSLR